MTITPAKRSRHTTLAEYPAHVVGVTLLDESRGFTGILSAQRGGRILASPNGQPRQRTTPLDVCETWLSKPGAQDKRTP